MSGGRTVPVIADDYVDMEFGTGALKVTPGHDPNDWEIGKRRDLEVINIMNKDASLNERAGRRRARGGGCELRRVARGRPRGRAAAPAA